MPGPSASSARPWTRRRVEARGDPVRTWCRVQEQAWCGRRHPRARRRRRGRRSTVRGTGRERRPFEVLGRRRRSDGKRTPWVDRADAADDVGRDVAGSPTSRKRRRLPSPEPLRRPATGQDLGDRRRRAISRKASTVTTAHGGRGRPNRSDDQCRRLSTDHHRLRTATVEDDHRAALSQGLRRRTCR